MLLDGGALASGDATAGETAPVEGRTKPRTVVNTQQIIAVRFTLNMTIPRRP